jgi:DNA-binding FadR family transcriptional regulator
VPQTKRNTRENQAETIERALAVAILRGDTPAHSQLPPLRTLAAKWSVTLPTIQRVVDRLASKGLVVVRRGSGVRVNAPSAVDLTLLPLWFAALKDQPERAAQILADFLDMRRVLLAHLLRTRWSAIEANKDSLTQLALELGQASSCEALAEADVRFSGALVKASGHFAAQAIFHTSASIVREVPMIMQAVYRDREAHSQTITRILTVLRDEDPSVDAVEAALQSWDERTVRNFLSLAQSSAAPKL